MPSSFPGPWGEAVLGRLIYRVPVSSPSKHFLAPPNQLLLLGWPKGFFFFFFFLVVVVVVCLFSVTSCGKTQRSFQPTQYLGCRSWRSGLNAGPAPHRVPADSHLAGFSGMQPPLGQRGVQRETLGPQNHTAGRDLGNCHLPSLLWIRKLSSKYLRSCSKLVSISEQI